MSPEVKVERIYGASVLRRKERMGKIEKYPILFFLAKDGKKYALIMNDIPDGEVLTDKSTIIYSRQGGEQNDIRVIRPERRGKFGLSHPQSLKEK